MDSSIFIIFYGLWSIIIIYFVTQNAPDPRTNFKIYLPQKKHCDIFPSSQCLPTPAQSTRTPVRPRRCACLRSPHMAPLLWLQLSTNRLLLCSFRPRVLKAANCCYSLGTSPSHVGLLALPTLTPVNGSSSNSLQLNPLSATCYPPYACWHRQQGAAGRNK